MKKVILLIFVSILLLFAFASCKFFKKEPVQKDPVKEDPPVEQVCKHDWTEATCTVAKTCKLCAATEGTPLKHQTSAPTCTEPEKCKVCGFTSDYWRPALGHDWAEASCLTGRAKTCRTCGITDGEIPQHQWSDPTCLDDSVCSVCNLTNKGTALGHDFAPTDPVAPTCTTPGQTSGSACTRCQTVEEGKAPQVVPAIEHQGHIVDIEGTPATCDTPGLTPGKKCELCGTVTEPQLTLDPKGHYRYTYNEDGSIKEDGFLRTEYPVNPDTGLPYAACESDGTTFYRCFTCGEEIGIVEPKVHHLYPDGATCSDIDAVCAYCSKPIEHEYDEPTCFEPSKCIICGDVQEGSVPLEHIMVDATCLAPKTCTLCGLTEGSKLNHILTFSAASGIPTYGCESCDSEFTPQDEYYYLDGSNHNHMVPVNNKYAGYDTHKDIDGNETQFPKIETDGNGNQYLSLIKVKDPELNDKGEAFPPQIQLWIPVQRGGFEGFNSTNSAVGFLSFKFNAFMDTNFSITFVEGGGWGDEDVIRNFFTLLPPATNQETGETKVQILAMDDGDADTTTPVIFEKDITNAASAAEKFTGWLDVAIGIVLDDATDTINLHYYINGEYKATVTSPLKTSANGFKCIYLSGNSNEIGSGIMIDDIAFGYTKVGSWIFDSNHEHNYTIVSDSLEPTCTTDGYKVYACECGSIGNRVAIPALGHSVHRVDALAPTCTDDGHSEYAYCTREGCGEELIKKELYSATGHDYKTTADRLATCTRPGALYQTCKTCGYINQVTRPALGHEYSLTADCTLGASCVRCDYVSTLPIGHTFAPATCTEPATCMREGCNVTEGQSLGHNFSDPTCTAPATCVRCAVTEGYRVPHTLSYEFIKSVLYYRCEGCDATFKIDNGYYLNGTGHKDMVVASGILNSNFTVAPGTQLPSIVDGHYEYINKTGNKGQLQAWIPTNDNQNNFGFSSENRAVGFLSFKMNTYIDAGNAIGIKLVDGTSNSGADRWTSRSVIGDINIYGIADGFITLKFKHPTDTAEIDICSLAVDTTNFTGWVDIYLGMEFNPDTDQVTYHFYVGGEYVISFSRTLTTKTNSINCIYLSGYTTVKGSGIMLDDIAFGYTPNAEWIFDTCRHNYDVEVIDPTCTEDGYTKSTCSVCGYISITDKISAFGHTELNAPDCTHGSLCATCGEYYGDALGHIGGKATCTESAVCDRCGESYGDPAHDIVEATCGAAAYCKACNEVFGEKVSHYPVLNFTDGKLVYTCKFCEKSYTLDQAYHQNGDDVLGPVLPLDENGVYNGGNLENGMFEFIHNETSTRGKAWVWLPTNGTGITDFEKFSCANGAVGVLSFSINTYTSEPFEVNLIDSDYRSDKNFWNNYSMNIMKISAPNNNVVTFTAADGKTVVHTVNVTDENKFTGMIDVTIGIEMLSGGKIRLHYYFNGSYSLSLEMSLAILSYKIDGVSFLGTSNIPGSGYILDNIGFGYAKPSESNSAPLKPEN